MKVLIVNKFLHANGGSETYIFKVGDALKQMGIDIEYFGMEHPDRIVGNSYGIYASNKDFKKDGIGSVFNKLTYPFSIIYSKEAYKKMSAILEQMKPDVVHLNNINFQLTPSIIEAAGDYRKRGNSCRIVATIHDPQWICPNHYLIRGGINQNTKEISAIPCKECFGGDYKSCIKYSCIHSSKLRSILGALEGNYYRTRHTYSLVDRIIAPSCFMAEIMENNPDLKGRVVMLRNFLDMPDLNKAHVDSKEMSVRLPDKYISYVGRYSAEKGIATLVETARALPDISFVTCGSGPLEEEVNKCTNITNLGFIAGNSLYSVLKNSYFSLITSECFENCPFTVMEANYCGTPVIGANIGGIPELIEEGITGELFTAGNSKELAEKIVKLWNDKNTIAKYRENLNKTHFDSIYQYMDKLLKIYEGN